MKGKNVFFSLFAAIALIFANLGASINCMGLFYQPKYPKTSI